MKRYCVFVLALLFSAGTAQGQVEWSIDKAHSHVGFKVKHLVVSTVKGNFDDFDVTFTSPGVTDFSGAELEAVIKTASIDTDNENRDQHLRSDDFLNAEKYPKMRFKSRSFEKNGDDTYTIAGNLTIRDVTKPVELMAVFNGTASFRGRTVASFDVTGEIDRMDYNVKWSQTLDSGGLVVSDTVTFDIFVEIVTQSGGSR